MIEDSSRAVPEVCGSRTYQARANKEAWASERNVLEINQSDVEKLQIPLPPLEVQKEIVAEIEGYQKVINGARAVLDHYRPHIPIHPDWPMVELKRSTFSDDAVTSEDYRSPEDVTIRLRLEQENVGRTGLTRRRSIWHERQMTRLDW